MGKREKAEFSKGDQTPFALKKQTADSSKPESKEVNINLKGGK